MRRAGRYLLGLGEEVVGPAIENHSPDYLQRHQLFGHKLGRVKMVKRERVRLLLCEELHRKLPLRKGSGLNGLEHVASMEVRVDTSDLHGLVPDRRLQAQLGAPVELAEGRLAFGVYEAKAGCRILRSSEASAAGS